MSVVVCLYWQEWCAFHYYLTISSLEDGLMYFLLLEAINRFKFFHQVMEQCIARLDVAMFNAILRESAHEIPTDPVSDPIVDSKVLPIPAGVLSFGSGAQLKNSVCPLFFLFLLGFHALCRNCLLLFNFPNE